ncbi:RDI1 [Sanghuangporus vaninii]
MTTMSLTRRRHQVGYKVTAPAKSPEEYAKMDAEDESLARWKASLGIAPGAAVGTAEGPKVTVLSLELVSPTLPAGKSLVLDLSDAQALAEAKKHPFTIKEGIEYNVRIRFKGVKYLQVVKRSGIKVDKMEQMLGSYGPSPEPYTKNFPTEESPSGMVARSGTYNVRSRVIDDDKEVYAGKVASLWVGGA